MEHRQVQVTVERSEQALLIRTNGVMDRSGATSVLRLIDLHVDLVATGRRPPAAVVIDVEGIAVFEPAGLRVLRHARSRARRGGQRLYLTGCGGRLHLLPFPVQQLLAEFDTFPTVEVAVAVLSTASGRTEPRGTVPAAGEPAEQPQRRDIPHPRTPVDDLDPATLDRP